jgi:hypothetical protein
MPNVINGSLHEPPCGYTALWDASKEAGLEVNENKTKYMFVSRHKTSVQNQYEKLTNIPFGNVGKLKCLTMTLANPNCIYKQTKFRKRLLLCSSESFLFPSAI